MKPSWQAERVRQISSSRKPSSRWPAIAFHFGASADASKPGEPTATEQVGPPIHFLFFLPLPLPLLCGPFLDLAGCALALDWGFWVGALELGGLGCGISTGAGCGACSTICTC